MKDRERYGEYSHGSANFGAILASLLIGFGAGAIISLLLAPQSGRQTRKFLRRKYGDALRGLNEQASTLREKSADLVEATRHKVKPFVR
jgi:gas vesicle protein